MYAGDSIELLKHSGINFERHERDGIDANDFAVLLMVSGLVLNDDIHWISFHSGYDFGYLLKLLTAQALPEEESIFFELFNLYFPRVYDIKYLMTIRDDLHGGLSKLAEDLGVNFLFLFFSFVLIFQCLI